MRESIADYLAELRRLTTYCEFGDYLEQALTDQLVSGIRSESIQERLLAEVDLTPAITVKLAQGMEAAEKNSRALKDTESSVQHFSAGTKFTTVVQKKKACYRCGQTFHHQKDCRFWGEDSSLWKARTHSFSVQVKRTAREPKTARESKT